MSQGKTGDGRVGECEREREIEREGRGEGGGRGKGGTGTALGNNSANGVTVWIFSRSRRGDYDRAISVTRFY